MSETGEAATTAAEAVPKVVRARMIIELEDGRAVYWEARDPQLAEVEHLVADPLDPRELGTLPAEAMADWLHGGAWFPPQPQAALRITGGIPWQVRIEKDSGEIPPALAEAAIPWIEGMTVAVGPLRVLLPYLARIAGKAR